MTCLGVSTKAFVRLAVVSMTFARGSSLLTSRLLTSTASPAATAYAVQQLSTRSQPVDRVLVQRGVGNAKEVHALLMQGRIKSHDGVTLRKGTTKVREDAQFIVNGRPTADVSVPLAVTSLSMVSFFLREPSELLPAS
jgi:hypothetical protein